MLNKIIKISLIIIFIGGSVYEFIQGNIGSGISYLLLSGIPLLFIYRHERILLSFVHLRKQDMTKALATLNKIKQPEHLVKGQQAYYYYLIGLCHSQTNISISEKNFKKALNIGLRMKQDQAIAKLNLAGVCIAKRRKREATMLLADAKKLDDKKMLSDQIKMVKDQLKKI